MVKEKSKLIKNITINQLATIINNGFNGQMEYMSKEFGEIKKEIGGMKTDISTLKNDVSVLKKDVKDIKNDLQDNIKTTNKLEMRVDYVENVMAIKKN